EQTPRNLLHELRGENVWMPLQIRPQEGFSPKRLTSSGISQEFVPERLQSADLTCAAPMYEINNAKPTPTQNLSDFICSTDAIALLVNLVPTHRNCLRHVSRLLGHCPVANASSKWKRNVRASPFSSLLSLAAN